uniref:ABC transporter ATP-binding protein n=1 Tax=Bosea sp. NBC_00436 TaxID=2969620 RepID=A0A9E8A492_9HYPH
MSLLSVERLHGGYGEGDILKGIDLHVEPREIVTVAGTNGAGKSTLIKAIMGLLGHLRGAIVFDGVDLLAQSVEARAELGISYVPQVANVFSTLTIAENLSSTPVPAKERPRRIEAMYSRFPVLKERKRTLARALSGGERQQLAFARALMTQPKLIILDEPTAALSPALSSHVFSQVSELRRHECSVLIVEQRARQSLAISDRGYILDVGKVAASGAATDLLADTSLAERFLGVHHD